MSKSCADCGVVKESSEFSPNSQVKDGLQSYCKQCQCARSKAARDKRKARDPEGYKAARKEQYLKYAEKHPEKIKAGTMRRHRVTPEKYQRLLENQDHKCAICLRPDIGGGRGRFHIDHDHGCCPSAKSCGNCVRGLLCTYCNTGLGGLRDDPRLLMQAIPYFSSGVVS